MNRQVMAHPNRVRRSRRAFTLIEILLVVVIIGMLATVLIVTVGGTREGAAKDITARIIDKVDSKIELYINDMGTPPTEGEGGLKALMTRPGDEKLASKWKGPYVQERELKDSWGNPLNYEPLETANSAGKRFRLWSNGPDQKANTDDDIPPRTDGNS